MPDEEISEEDIARVQRVLDRRDNKYQRRNELPYYGVLGPLPEWVPEWHQNQFEVTRNRLLDYGAFDKPVSPDVARGYLDIYTQLGEEIDSKVAKPGEQRDGPEWIPPEIVQDVGYLAHVRWAVSLGEVRGLQELSGRMAVRGAGHSKGYSKGGRANKKKKGIWAAVQVLVKADSTITSKAAWLSFSDGSDIDASSIAGFEVYRDGARLVQLDGKTGREIAITYRTFQRYVSETKRSK